MMAKPLLRALCGRHGPAGFAIDSIPTRSRLDFQLLSAAVRNPISSFFGLDVIVTRSCCGCSSRRRRRAGVRWLGADCCPLLVGVSLALPLFLYLRELHVPEHRTGPANQRERGHRATCAAPWPERSRRSPRP